MSISVRTRVILWGRAASRCSFPDCGLELVKGSTETDDESLVGDAAHIVAESPEGPRGDSPVEPPDRNKYSNLILLCKVHHKLIDDQPNTYTVDVLKKMKKAHEDSIRLALSPEDISRQKDNEIYATYVDKWTEWFIDDWNDWSSNMLRADQPAIPKPKVREFEDAGRWILGRIWPRRYKELENAFENFRVVLQDLLMTFSEHSEIRGEWLQTARFYRIREYNEKLYNELLFKYEHHVALVSDYILELTRAANYVCDRVREFLDPNFRMEEGMLLVESGPYSDFSFRVHRVQYDKEERTDTPYPGRTKFQEVRFTRDYYFGDPKRKNTIGDDA